MGHTACLTDGTVSAGGTCTFGTAGETTGFDNCKRGLACVGGTCQTICSASPDTCSTNHACVIYSSAPFDIDGMTGVREFAGQIAADKTVGTGNPDRHHPALCPTKE